MLPKQYRLPKNLFRELFKNGKRLNTPELQCVIVSNNRTIPRFAVVVGLKISKNAVVRNRIKRLIRESIHHLLPSIVHSFDCVVLIKQNIVEKTQIEVEKTLQQLFQQV